jgi:DNA-binding response OmpR family regulator
MPGTRQWIKTPLAPSAQMRHDSGMSKTSPVRPEVNVLAILSEDPAGEIVRKLLAEEGLSVTAFDTADRKEAWRKGVSAQAVVVDEALEPAEVAEALDRGWIASTAPVFVLARRLPDRDRYVAWLEAGAWDILKIPLEGIALALRLRNMLEGHLSKESASRAQRYSVKSLALAADEALALAHRYERPLHCAALAVDWPEAGETDLDPLMERLADACQRLTRRSDLIGLGGRRTILLLLPDTNAKGTGIFLDRLKATLEERLMEWEVVATLHTASVDAVEAESGQELLEAVVRGLGVSPP